MERYVGHIALGPPPAAGYSPGDYVTDDTGGAWVLSTAYAWVRTNSSASASAFTAQAAFPTTIHLVVGDETSSITTGTAKLTFRMPFAMTVTAVRASVNTVSSSGLPTVDVKEEGVSIFSTLLTIDASEKTSQTAATPAVVSDTALADDAEMTVDITVAGTGAKGLKLWLIGTRAVS